MGPVWMCRAAWPHMRSKGYGRIVNITSSAFAGVSWLAAYAASKGGLFSLTRSLAAEGAALGIKANSVNPGAFTRMVAAQQEETSPMYRHAMENLPAELVSPVVAFLAHESCPVSGECIEAVGGEVRRILHRPDPGLLRSRARAGDGRASLERGDGWRPADRSSIPARSIRRSGTSSRTGLRSRSEGRSQARGAGSNSIGSPWRPQTPKNVRWPTGPTSLGFRMRCAIRCRPSSIWARAMN